MIEFGILGPLRVRVDGRDVPIPAGLGRTLLAALLLRAGEVVPADRLVDWLWDGVPRNPERAKATLQMVVVRLRRALGEANVIRTTTGGYVADVPSDSLDLHRYRALAGQGRHAEALGVWRGDPLPDVRSDLLHREEVAPLLDHRLDVLEQRFDADLEAGRASGVVEELRLLTRRHPLRERFWAQLVMALHRSQRQAEALAAYQEVRSLLVEELGVEPGPALREVHQRVLGEEPVASAGRAGVPRQLPVRPRLFTGRRDALAELNAAAAGSTAVISAINGTAGIGKTALAVHWAHEVAPRFPDGQLYVNLRGYDPSGRPMPPEDALRGFLEALDVPPSRIPPSVQAQASLYRSLLADRRVLVVLDNARDADQVRPLLPGTPGCLVLVTSRDRLTGLVVREGARPLRLDLLDRDEAVALLEAGVGRSRSAAEPDAVSRLVARCAGLPLALAVVAARTAVEPSVPLCALADELAVDGTRLDALDTGDRLTSVRDVFSWSYRYLTGAAARMFRLLGLHPGPDISLPAAASLAALPLAEARRVLAELARAHLVAEHAPGRYALHDLLRAYAADQATEDSPADLREAGTRLYDHLLHTTHAAVRLIEPARLLVAVAPPAAGATVEPLVDGDRAWAWLDGNDRVLRLAVEHARTRGFDVHGWQLPWLLTTYFERRGRWRDWTAALRAGLVSAERLDDRKARADLSNYLGHALTWRGEFDQGRAVLRRTLDLYRELGDTSRVAHVQRALAWGHYSQGGYEPALTHLEQALELSREIDDVRGVSAALNTLGHCLILLGKPRQALEHCLRSAALSHEHGYRYSEANALDSVGLAHHRLGDHAGAMAYYERALALVREIGDRPLEGEVLNNIGDTHQAAGDLDAARSRWREALVVFGELGHAGEAAVRAKLAGPGPIGSVPGEVVADVPWGAA